MRYVIFDFDGTLADSMWIWENADINFLKRYNKFPSPAIRELVKTLSLKETAELFIAEFGLNMKVDRIIEEIGQMGEGSYQHEVLLKPYVREYLEKLKKNNVRMCIATACTKKNVTLALNRLGIIDFFEFVITSDDVPEGKRSPKMYLLCAEKFGAPPDDIVVFEDAPHAIETAKSAGFYVVGIFDEYSSPFEDDIKKMCDLYINNFKEMDDLL